MIPIVIGCATLNEIFVQPEVEIWRLFIASVSLPVAVDDFVLKFVTIDL